MNLARPLKLFGPALPLLLALCCVSPLPALDPDTVFLKVTQAQKVADGRYQVTLQWNSVAGADYRVQGQEGLSGTGWIDFGIVRPTGSTGQWIGTIAADLVDQGRFFMRLVLPQEGIDSLEPAFVATGGGVFYILGVFFSVTDRVFVNGVEAAAVVFEDHTRLQVTMGATAAGVYDVEVRGSDGTTVHAKLTDSLAVNATGRSDEVPPTVPLVNNTDYGPTFGKGHDLFLWSIGVRPPSGEVVQSSIDLAVPGRGPAFVWARTYRSKNGPSTAQGEGWDFSYNISATQSGGDVVVRDGEGRADTFFNQGDGTWSRPEFFRQGTMGGTVFTLTFADKTAWRFRAFDAPLAAGKIDRITDRNGNHLDCAYDGAGRLQTITDTLGKNFTVAYNGAGKIQSVTDFTGRAVTYGYNAAGDLTSVTSPPVTGTPTANDFPAGKTTTFTYSSGFADARLNHNLLTVTSPLGHVVLTNTYAPTLVPTELEFDRCVTCSRDPGPPYPTEEVSFYHMPQTSLPANRFATTLTIINNHGNVSEVRSDSRNRPLEVREYTGRSPIGLFVTDVANRPTGQLRAGDPVFFATKFEWNPDSLPARIEVPRGGLIEKWFQGDFDPPGSPNPRERGNLRVQVTTAAPAVPSDFTTITQTWQYLQGFGTCEGGGWAGKWGGDSSSTADDECILVHTPLKHSDATTPSDSRFLAVDAENNLYAGGLTSSSINPTGGTTDEDPFKFEFKVGCDSGFAGGDASEFATRPVIKLKLTSPDYCPRLPDADGLTTGLRAYSYPTVHVDPNGGIWTGTYDLFGNPLTVSPPIAGTGHTFEYNGFGQPTVHIWPLNANGSARRDEFNYYNAGPQNGWLQSVEADANNLGLITTFEYNSTGATTRIINPLGKDTLITRNALNQPVRVASREASAGVRHETDVRYDANNNVTSVDVQNKDETGAVVVANPYFTTQYQYDSLNRPVRVIREVDAATTITMERVVDADNHTVTIRSPEAFAGTQPLNTVRFAFDERGLPFQITRAPGAAGQSTTRIDYDLDGNAATVSRGLESAPRVWQFVWDGMPLFAAPTTIPGMFDGNAGNTKCNVAPRDCEQEPTSVEVPNLVITFAESHGRLLYDWHEDFVIGFLDRCLDNDEDNYGTTRASLRSITDPMGNVTTATRDANGNLIKLRIDGEHNDVAGSAGNVRLCEYQVTVDNNDLPVIFTSLLLDPSGAQTGSVSSSITRAPNSQPASATDPRGNVTTFGYDTANRLNLVTDAKTNTRAFAYDANGNVLTVTATDKSDLGNPQQVFVITRTFDGLDRPLTRADNVGNTTQYAYDSRSNLVLDTDARNIQTRYVYDGLCRPLSSARDMDNDGASAADPQDIVLSRTWDRNSRLATTTNALGFVTTLNYDALNRRVITLEADGTTSGAVTYDVHGNVTQCTDANGTTTVYAYDALNRLTAKNIAPGAGVATTTTGESFGYDGLSRLKIANSTGTAPTTSSYAYDSLGRPVSETLGALTITCVFDAAGNVTSLAYPGGNIVTATYDSLNRPLAVADSVSGAIVTNSYVGPGRIERQNFGNGTTTTIQYDGIQGIPNAPGDSGWRRIRGMITTGPGGSPNHEARQYFYDANQNRTGRVNLLNNRAHQYTFDNADRLVNTIVQQGGPPIRNTNYALDKAGNRQNVSGDLHPGAYQMNPALPNPGDAQMNQYTLAPTGTFTYDANGNRQNHNTGAANLQHQYDYANRLVAVNNLTTAQPVATYRYDALGRRIQKTEFPGGVPTTTNFVFSSGTIIEERDGGGTVQATAFISRLMEQEGILYYQNIAPAVVNRRGNLHTLHADPSGSIVCLTNAAGAPAERYDYQDFGEPEFYTAAFAPLIGSVLGNPILFCSHRYDSETGFIHIPRIGQEVIVDFALGPGAGKAYTNDLSFTSSPIDKSSAGLMQGASVGRSSTRSASNPSAVIGGKGYFDPKTGSSPTR